MLRMRLLVVVWLWTSPALMASHVFQIPHIAGSGWLTTLTIYNDGDRPATVLLRQWNEVGGRILETSAPAPAHGRLVWTREDLIPEGIAAVSTEEDRIRVKLSYQYTPSQSLCELFLTPDASGARWLLPNLHPELYPAFSVATANFGRQTASVSLTAFKEGVEIKTVEFGLRPGRKKVASSLQLWGLESRQVDTVVLVSDQPIGEPLAISGTSDQKRYKIIAGDRIESSTSEQRFFVPHIPAAPWITRIVIFNAGADPATIALHQYNDSGTEIGGFARKVPAHASIILSTGSQGVLPGIGTAVITGRGALSVRLSYRYGESESISEYLASGDISRRWFLPNPMQVGFDWYGIALQNPSDTTTSVRIRAYKDGQEVAASEVSVGPRQKYSAFSEQALSLKSWEFDMVSLEAGQPIPMPISVTGNRLQDRHLSYAGQPSADLMKPRKWAFLFYNDSEFDGAFNPGRDFAGETWSGPNVDVLMLEDTTYTPTTLYYVNPNRSLAILEPPKEKNMGDPDTLYNFIMKAKAEFPAERYILAVYDHGMGWQGCCIDQTSQDFLTMDEMRQAIVRAGGVDLTLFTAPCLMAQLESVYEIRDWTDVYVGSEDLSGYMWIGTMQFIRSMLSADPDITNQDLGRRIVDSIVRNLPASQSRSQYSFKDSYTISAIDTKGIDALTADLDALAVALLAQPQEMRSRIAAIWNSVQNYYNYYSTDLYDFLEKYAALESRSDVLALIRKVQASLNACILSEAHGPANPGSHGISIYLPLAPNVEYQNLYSDLAFGLSFAANTKWAELVKCIKTTTLKHYFFSYGTTAGLALTMRANGKAEPCCGTSLYAWYRIKP
jgi:hypothetical protein